MAKAKFYTYIHRRADTGEVFYVGKGSGRRATFIHQRSEYWNRVASAHGFVVEFVAYFYEECHAMDHEVFLISEYRNSDVRLVNHTNGGEGTSGWVHSDEAKEKMSKASKGRVVSSTAKANMSAAGRGRVMSAEHRMRLTAANVLRFSDPAERAKVSQAQAGKVLSDETRAKIRETKRLKMSGFGRICSDDTRKKMSDTRQEMAAKQRALRQMQRTELINAQTS